MKGSWARRFFGIMRPPPLSSLHRVCRGVSDRSRPMSFLHGHSTSVIHSASPIATAQTRSCSKVAVVAQLRQNILNKLDSNELGFGRISDTHKDCDWSLMLKEDTEIMNQNITAMIKNDVPVLQEVAGYYFTLRGKRMRPSVILLLSRLLNHHLHCGDAQTTDTELEGIVEKQRKLAEITEMIHTASLIHDDVIDEADTRRGAETSNVRYSNKIAILAGDFLLARASVSLAQLRSHRVTQLISEAIANLVEGELVQMDCTDMETYMRKTYLKTASLIAKSCESTAVLAGCKEEDIVAARQFGTHLGLAFQLVDDCLDYTSSSDTLGKPALIDLSLGLATGPVLYAMRQFPQLQRLIERRFKQDGDATKARELVEESDGIMRTMDIAGRETGAAVDVLQRFPECSARDGLEAICRQVLQRRH